MNELEQEVRQKVAVANRDVMEMRDIHRRTMELRERATQQLLQVEGKAWIGYTRLEHDSLEPEQEHVAGRSI